MLDVNRTCPMMRSRYGLPMQEQSSQSMHAIIGCVTRGRPLLMTNWQWACALPAKQWGIPPQPGR